MRPATTDSQGTTGGDSQKDIPGSPVSASSSAAAHCASPQEVYTVASALTVFFASNLTQEELQTLINLLVLLQTGLSAIVTQQQICEGIVVQPPE